MNKAIVLAGGQGTRLWPLTAVRPKPLVPMASRPVMAYLLEWLRHHGIREVLVTLHYRAEDIRQAFGAGQSFGLEVTYQVEEEPLGTAGAVRAASNWVDGKPFLIVSGDALTDVDLSTLCRFHQESGGWMTLGLKRVSDPWRFGVAELAEGGLLSRFQEKPQPGHAISELANTGIYCVEPRVLELVPKGQKSDWSCDLFPRLLADGLPLFGFELEGYWRDVGSLSDYHRAQVDALERKLRLELPATEVRPGIYQGAGTRVASSAVIEGPVLLGAGSRVEPEALILPGSIVGEGAVVRSGACLWNAVIGAGCYVGPTAVLRDCLVDDCVHLGAGAQVWEGAVIGLGCHVAPGLRVAGGVRIEPGEMLLAIDAADPDGREIDAHAHPARRERQAPPIRTHDAPALEESPEPAILPR
jgi:mannose-1-phosphate guanylyltransferase / phosphomannomutase